MVKIAVLASFNMDLVMRTERLPRPGETLQGDFAQFLGGKGFNQAIAARRLGAEVAVTGRIGSDHFGLQFLAVLEREGIDHTPVTVDETSGTGVATVLVDARGENAILQAPRANRTVSARQIVECPELFDAADVAMLQLETSIEAAVAFAASARERGVTTLFNPAPAAPVPDELLLHSDVLVPNELEARTLSGLPGEGIDGAIEMAQALLKRGPRAVVITLGEGGAIACAHGLRVHVPAFSVPVVDTVGAGDAFCGALAVRLGEGAALEEGVRFACAAGAVACGRPGAEPSMPQRAQVEELLGKGVQA